MSTRTIGDWLRVAQDVNVAVIDAQWRLAEATQARDAAVRQMLADLPAAAVAEVFGLTRSRVYQIRDGKR